MSNLHLGYQLKNQLPEDIYLLFFVSTFCSKCMQTRQILASHSLLEHALEINIATLSTVLLELTPQIIPTLVLLNSERQVIYIKEGQMHPKELEMLASAFHAVSKE